MESTPGNAAVTATCLATLCGGVTILHARYRSQHFARHAHENYALGVIESGALAFRYRGEGVVAPTGHLSLAQPGEPHDGAPAGPDGWAYRMTSSPRSNIPLGAPRARTNPSAADARQSPATTSCFSLSCHPTGPDASPGRRKRPFRYARGAT